MKVVTSLRKVQKDYQRLRNLPTEMHPETALVVLGRAWLGHQLGGLARRFRTVLLDQVFEDGGRLGHDVAARSTDLGHSGRAEGVGRGTEERDHVCR